MAFLTGARSTRRSAPGKRLPRRTTAIWLRFTLSHGRGRGEAAVNGLSQAGGRKKRKNASVELVRPGPLTQGWAVGGSE